MEKNKVLLTDKVTKENLKSPTFKKWVMRVLCFACILSLAFQLVMCVAPMSASAEDSISIQGVWTFNSTVIPFEYDDYVSGSTLTKYIVIDFTSDGISYSQLVSRVSTANIKSLRYYPVGSTSYITPYSSGSWSDMNKQTIDILSTVAYDNNGNDITTSVLSWLNANATKVVTTVYDFTGEYRIFKPTLDIGFSSTQTVQTYQFDFNIYGGYNADYMSFVSDADEVTMSYAFTDEGSGGLRMMYRQGFGDDSGTWLVPRARVIYFQSNPDDPTFQQWLLDNTILVAPDSIDVIYDAGYSSGFNDGWTDNIIGDTLNAPIQALNNMVLLETADVTITLGGVVVTMIALSILIVYLKKYAGG